MQIGHFHELKAASLCKSLPFLPTPMVLLFTPPLCTSSPQSTHLNICTGPSCRQTPFSRWLPRTLTALSPSCAEIHTCGCLGECGNGPNVGVTSSTFSPFIRKHVHNINAAAELVREACGGLNDEATRVLALGDAYKRGDLDRMQDFVGKDEVGVMGLVWLGKRLMERGELGKADEMINRALEVEQGNVEAWKLKMKVMEENGEWDGLVRTCQVVEKLVHGRERDSVKKTGRQAKIRAMMPWGR